MITVRKSGERGRAKHGWLDTRHTFSFADYHDPKHVHFRCLRALNEDVIAPGMGFGEHPHRDMEIITYVVSGVLRHRDSMGHTALLRAGEIQRISAGTGITHSEFNGSTKEPVHLLQIWLQPNRLGVAPNYAEKSYAEAETGRLLLAVSGSGREDSIPIHQDAEVYFAKLTPEQRVTLPLKAGRHVWLQVIAGEIEAGEVHLTAGDGAAFSRVNSVKVTGIRSALFLLFDLN
jgi:hypothetical protein